MKTTNAHEDYSNDALIKRIKELRMEDTPQLQRLLREARRRVEIHVSQCQNCDTVWLDDELDEIQDMRERVSAGEIVPSGQCPECHCLCHRLRPLRRQPTNTKR